MILAGDWAPGGKNVDFHFDISSCCLANLEGPFVGHDRNFPAMAKAGPHLSTNSVPVVNYNLVLSLANNHIMDYGAAGLEATLTALDQKSFMTCGAGENISAARKPVVVEDSGVRVGIIACCEAQFGVAGRNSAGVADFGPWVYRAIRELRETVDAVIVSVHAAVEESSWPSPYIRELYRSYIDEGATVVHGHHAHVPQGYEAYGEGIIFYGMGNFAVDPDKWRDYPHGMWSLAADADFGLKPHRWRVLTLEIRHQPGSDHIVIEESNHEERARRWRYLEICNRPLDNSDLFDALWQEVALRVYFHHAAEYMRFSASSQSGRSARARAGLSMIKDALLNRTARTHPTQYDYLLWHCMIACESHRQMLSTALGVLAGEIKDLRTEETRQLADEIMPWSRGVGPR